MGSLSEYVVDLPEHRAAAGGVCEGDVRTRHLEQGLDGGGERPEDRRVHPLDAVDCHGDVGQQDRGIVVAIVGRHLSDPRPPALGPLREHGRLAVARRGDDGQQRRSVGGRQPVDEGGAGHDPGTGRGAWSVASDTSKAGFVDGRPARPEVLRCRPGARVDTPREYRALPFTQRNDRPARDRMTRLGLGRAVVRRRFTPSGRCGRRIDVAP